MVTVEAQYREMAQVVPADLGHLGMCGGSLFILGNEKFIP